MSLLLFVHLNYFDISRRFPLLIPFISVLFPPFLLLLFLHVVDECDLRQGCHPALLIVFFGNAEADGLAIPGLKFLALGALGDAATTGIYDRLIISGIRTE